MAPRKSHPKGIDPAYPNRNFVKMTFVNKGEMDKFSEYMYGNFMGEDLPTKKASGFGHSVEKRVGKLRMSGMPGAHRIGKR